jgi:type IV pilus assembly protein PilB
VFELLIPDHQIEALVVKRASSDAIKQHCLKTGRFETLRRDGLRKALDGVTTLEQVLGVAQSE